MKARTSCRRLLQLIFAMLNIAYFAIGTMVLSVGIYLSVTNHSLALITGDTNISGAVLLILSGGITLVVALLGVCGSLFPKKWLLILYTVLMIFVFIAELSLGIVGIVYQSSLTRHVENSVFAAIKGYQQENTTSSNSNEDNQIIDIFQEGFSCCGYNGPSDWLNTQFMNSSSDAVVPQTCHCAVNQDNTNCNATLVGYPKLYVWNKGCGDVLLNIIREYSISIGVVAILFGVFQILAIFIAICILCCINRKVKHNSDLIAPS